MKNYIFIAIVLVLSLFTVLPLFHSGLYTMHDHTQVARVYQMAVSIEDGMFPVRWVKDLGYGYGYPIFNFYAPLPYYTGALFYFITSSPLAATKIMIGLGTLLAAVTMYIFASRFMGKWAGIASAVTYMYFPYHALNIYVRGAIGEVFAYAFLPLVFYGVFNLFYSKKNVRENFSNIIITALSFAALVVSHNLTAFMLTLVLLPVLLMGLALHKDKKKFFLLVFFSFILGFMLSAFYSFPAILEMGATDVKSQVGGGADFHDHFVCFTQYINGVWGYAGSAPGCLDGLSFAWGKNNILIILSVVLFSPFYFLKKRKEKENFKYLIISIFLIFLVSLFFTLELSQPIWEITPFIEFIQFPWRFINFISLSIAIFAGFLVYFLNILNFKKTAVLSSVLIIVSQLLFHTDIFKAQDYNYLSDKEYMNEKRLRFEISKISDEYLPQKFSIPQSEKALFTKKIEVTSGKAEIKNIKSTTDKISANINVSKKSQIKLNMAPFPAWKLFINNKKADFSTKNDGVYFTLEKGSYDIVYKYISTPVEKSANVISLFGFAVIVIGIISIRKK